MMESMMRCARCGKLIRPGVETLIKEERPVEDEPFSEQVLIPYHKLCLEEEDEEENKMEISGLKKDKLIVKYRELTYEGNRIDVTNKDGEISMTIDGNTINCPIYSIWVDINSHSSSEIEVTFLDV